MTAPSDQPPSLVEESPDEGSEKIATTLRSLQLRIRQQEILAELGVLALQGAVLADLLNETVRLTAEGLEADFCKVLEYIRSENRLLVRAGVGWDPGVIGQASVGADIDSPAGFALKTGKPVISNHLENEERFRTPELLVQHGIRRAINVILQGDGSPFGVLEVDSRSEGDFGENDITFLQGAANILGMAIERQRYERSLKAAIDRHELLLKEINHRAKNSLQVVASMLRMQAGTTTNENLASGLQEAASRVITVGKAYERLAYDDGHDTVDLAVYLKAVLADLGEVVSANIAIVFQSEPGVSLDSDRAILLGLIVNELVTNAAKYAYPEGTPGTIRVDVARRDAATIDLVVTDQGIGLPVNLDPRSGQGLGSRLIAALTAQLHAELVASSGNPGASFRISLPSAVS